MSSKPRPVFAVVAALGLLFALLIGLPLFTESAAAEPATRCGSPARAEAQSRLPFTSTFIPLLQDCGGIVIVTATPEPTASPTPDPWTAPAASIEVFSPVANAAYHSPIEVIGYSQTFEGSVVARVRDSKNDEIALRPMQGGSVDGYDFFRSQLRFFVSEIQTGTVEIFEISAMDGSEINKVTRPIYLLPGQRSLDLTSPEVDQVLCDGIPITGYSNTFEATVVADVVSRSGSPIASEIAMGGNLGFYRPFQAFIEDASISPSLATAATVPLLVGAHGDDAIGLGPVDYTRVPIAYRSECPAR